MNSLSSRSALVTGGAQGIGRAVAHQLAKSGAKVMIADIKGEKVLETAALLAKEGLTVAGIGADVGDPAGANLAVDSTVERYGAVDIVANVAGGGFGDVAIKNIEDITDDMWDETVRINLRSTFLVTRAATSHMRERRYGRVINFSSGAAQGSSGSAATISVRLAYAASKGGIQSFTFQLAKDLVGTGITAHAILPGFVLTEPGARAFERFNRLDADVQTAMLSALPGGQAGRAEDTGWVVAFLASEAASHLSGLLLSVPYGVSGKEITIQAGGVSSILMG